MLPGTNCISEPYIQFFFLKFERIISGNNLLIEKSPPPITFPALQQTIPNFLLLFSLCKYFLISISSDALLALYGSFPPKTSVSTKEFFCY